MNTYIEKYDPYSRSRLCNHCKLFSLNIDGRTICFPYPTGCCEGCGSYMRNC